MKQIYKILFIFAALIVIGSLTTATIISNRGIEVPEVNVTGNVNVGANLSVKGGSPWVDITSYGAVANDGVNDSFAWENLLAAHPNGNVNIFIPCGQFDIGESISLSASHNNINIFGHGKCSLLKLMNSVDNDVMVISSDEVTLSRFAINGNEAGQGTTSRGIDTGAFVNNLLIESLFINNTRNEGIFVLNGLNVVIKNCLIQETGHDGIELWKPTYYQLHNNRIHDVTGNGILVQGDPNRYGVITDNVITKILTDEKAGISVIDGRSAVIDSNFVKDSFDTALGVNGIFVRSEDVVISNNLIINITGAGIESNKDNVVISGNRIIKNQDATAESSGISINDASNVVITSNSIDNTSRAGIKIGSVLGNISNIIISNNLIRNSNTTGIRLFSSSTFIISNVNIKDNIIFDNSSTVIQDWGIKKDGLGDASNIEIAGNLIYGISSDDITGFSNLSLGFSVFESGISLNDTITGGNAGSNICIDANKVFCVCGSCA